jgi:hypothetical protein
MIPTAVVVVACRVEEVGALEVVSALVVCIWVEVAIPRSIVVVGPAVVDAARVVDPLDELVVPGRDVEAAAVVVAREVVDACVVTDRVVDAFELVDVEVGSGGSGASRVVVGLFVVDVASIVVVAAAVVVVEVVVVEVVVVVVVEVVVLVLGVVLVVVVVGTVVVVVIVVVVAIRVVDVVVMAVVVVVVVVVVGIIVVLVVGGLPSQYGVVQSLNSILPLSAP